MGEEKTWNTSPKTSSCNLLKRKRYIDNHNGKIDKTIDENTKKLSFYFDKN